MAARKKETTHSQADFDNMKDELQVSLLAAEDIKALRAKVCTLVIRLREEKEEKLRISSKHDMVSRKMEMLANHMEKLMNHLRIESKQKCRIIESRRALRKELDTMRDIAARQQKIIESKNRYIAEISEGSKLLEDQLRLMDDKYLEMRKKLDFAREQNKLEVGRAEKSASSLRRKFQILTGSTKLLDRFEVPEAADQTHYGHSSSRHGPESNDPRGVSWADFPDSPASGGGGGRSGPARVRSAPALRPKQQQQHGKYGGNSQSNIMSRDEVPNLDNILNKIERKKAEHEGTKWSVNKVKMLLASSTESSGQLKTNHTRPTSGRPPLTATNTQFQPQPQAEFLSTVNFAREYPAAVSGEISPAMSGSPSPKTERIPARASSFAVLDSF